MFPKGDTSPKHHDREDTEESLSTMHFLKECSSSCSHFISAVLLLVPRCQSADNPSGVLGFLSTATIPLLAFSFCSFGVHIFNLCRPKRLNPSQESWSLQGSLSWIQVFKVLPAQGSLFSPWGIFISVLSLNQRRPLLLYRRHQLQYLPSNKPSSNLESTFGTAKHRR